MTRDWRAWHEGYDDPGSGLAWRLAAVRGHVAEALDRRAGPVRVLSVCAGDGRDVLGVLADRPDAARVSATLVELDPVLGDRARAAAAATDADVTVLTADAGDPATYAGLPPADLLLLCGIFGNVSPADIEHTITAAPALCGPGATVLWTRGRGRGFDDLDADVRRWFGAAGFVETAHETLDEGHHPTVGAVRLDVEPPATLPTLPALPALPALPPDRRLFTFR
ncbi:hypothetical protein GCM10023340_20690 [Nocardioides marinquilinus]|uniref:Methyltransferase domain-containing protein n=1 Tax=Nocardioides marinquilinus TaxID=1210400 RepID=A0ABP9PJP2_9ACTN